LGVICGSYHNTTNFGYRYSVILIPQLVQYTYAGSLRINT